MAGTFAEGIAKRLAFKRETTEGVIAGPTGATVLRRVTGSWDLQKETFESGEIRQDYQRVDYRHGGRSVEGSINGELSAGSYSPFFAAALMRDFTAGGTAAALAINLNATTKTMTRAAGSWLTDGFKIGDVVRATAFTNPTNNARNLLIITLTATVLTFIVLDGGTLITEATATGISVAVFGKRTFTPLTGHTDDSFTFEEFYSGMTTPQSEVYVGNKLNTLSVSLPASGLTTCDFSFMGLNLAQTGTTAYFTTPTAAGTSGIFAAVNGALVINGVQVGYVTGLNFNINRNMTKDFVVGSNVSPSIFEGRVVIDGEFTAMFTDGVYRDLFINETESSLVVALTASNAPNADFITFAFPRIKVNGANKDDGEKGIVRTFPFVALLNSAGGTGTATDATTLQVNDSLAL